MAGEPPRDTPPIETDRQATFSRLLRAWGRTAPLGDRLGGGCRNDIRLVHVAGVRYAGRLSRRSAAALDWESDLLDRLRIAGFRVPRPLPALDGRWRADGLVLLEWIDGNPPAALDDWRRVADVLGRLHEATADWPQRPGFRSTRALLDADRGGEVRLDLMPKDAVRRCRDAWRELAAESTSVIHGDPGAPNIRIGPAGVGLIDWDEARVDASVLDLAHLPDEVVERQLPPRRLGSVRRAANAWEAANGWLLEPTYARRRLAEV